MGIHGIYKEIGPGRRVALSKLSSEIYVANNRPFRLAIDVSIWLFQIQSGKGGSNPALRTFYYRLLRLICLNIHPLFVFDGPNKPLFKRNKRVGGPGVKVSSIPEFLAKQLLKHFGFPMHLAPGEAEAECALLQRMEIVDGVLSEDVDTLMFGSGLTLRSWTPEGRSGKTPTHVNVYDAAKTKETSGLDREGMVLVAMMSGGDYIPEGIPGCGPKLACEAARAGFGSDLCRLRKNDKEGIRKWKERLCHEIRSNESKFFKQKRTALTIPEDFPNVEVLSYYTHPVISGPEKLQRLKDTLKWDMPLDYASLRDFAKDAFDWQCIGGAKKFIRNLAPAMLTRELRLRGEAIDQDSDGLDAQNANEAKLVNAIHGKRNHASTDAELELRVSFVPVKLVDIDLSIEDPDDELPVDDEEDSESDPPASQAVAEEDDGCLASPKKKRGPSVYDPTVPEKIWMLGTFVRIGVPLMVQDFEAQFNDPMKFASRNAPKVSKPRRKAAPAHSGMQRGALDRFAVSMKPGVPRESRSKSQEVDKIDLSETTEAPMRGARPPLAAKNTKKIGQQIGLSGFGKVTKAGVTRVSTSKSTEVDELDLSGIDAIARSRSAADKATSIASVITLPQPISVVEATDLSTQPARRMRKRPSPEPASPLTLRTASPPRKLLKQPETISLLSSSPDQAAVPRKARERARTPAPPELDLRHQFVRDARSPQVEVEITLPDTVTRRRIKAPFKRHRTAPTTGEESDEDMPLSRPLRSPSPVFHDTVEAMDLGSPSPRPMIIPTATLQSPESEADCDLPSPSMFKLKPAKPAVMTVADIRAVGTYPGPPRTMDEWRLRSQSVTPNKARFVDRLFQPAGQQAIILEKQAILTVESSMPTPPVDEQDMDELDVLMSRKSSPAIKGMTMDMNQNIHDAPAPLAQRAEISAGDFLLANKNLRSRDRARISVAKERPARARNVDGESIQSADTLVANRVAEDEETIARIRSKPKKKFVQPRESLPGSWKVVDEVDLSRPDQRYKRAFRMSEVECVDLTGG